jgi:ribosomal protein S18 acetylase RimI-like enzyme
MENKKMVELNKITIRELNGTDASSFIELKKLGLTTDPNAFVADPDDDKPTYPKEVEIRLKNASIQKGDIIIGAFDTTLVGIVSVTKNTNKKRQHKADLHGMYIKPEYRGIGLGKELLKKAMDMAKEIKGLEEIELIVAAYNESTVNLYKKFGFEKTYLEEHALKIKGNYIDAYHMKKEIKEI